MTRQQDDLPDPGASPIAPAALLLAEIARLKAELAAMQAKIAELEAKADVDPLTDILNRRGFERELARSLAYVKRYGTPAVLVYLDLDGFKAINDRHGHAAGDKLLKAVTARLTGQVRASDVVGRLGGDEFAVLMWNVDAAAAAAKARELEALIAAERVRHGGAELSVGAPPALPRSPPTPRRRRCPMRPTRRCMRGRRSGGRSKQVPSFRDARRSPQGEGVADPESRAEFPKLLDSGFALSARPGMTKKIPTQ